MKTNMQPLLFSSFYILLFLVPFSGCGNNHHGAIEASGTLEAVDVNVSSKVSGQLLQLLVNEGSLVKAGDTLVILDHDMLTLQLRQTEAGVNVAAAQYDLLKNGAREEDIKLGKASVVQAEASFTTAETDYKRIKELFEQHSVSQKQYEDAESRYTITKAQLISAEQNLQKLVRFARPEDLNAAKARVEQAQAQANIIKKQIRDSYIIAPSSGTITNKPVEEGELIGAGAVVARISRLEKMELRIYVSETELGKVKLGGDADVVIDTYPDKSYPGKVVYVSPTAEFTPRNVQTKDERTKLVFGIKLEVDNPNGDLKSGMPADAYLK
ncbi:MAG: efflux RND transporter periplasmic adaptor subunit [Bacteroidota bacterium]|nr:efflux RND transporter periplasmic adaptor subunit [Bacteroidota bacterium]